MANFNLNKVILGGRLTSDPEQKQTPKGTSVATFSMAINRKPIKDQPAATDFINCVAWSATADFIARYFKRGSAICIVGQIQTRNYTDKQGKKVYVTEVIVDEASFVDSKGDVGTALPSSPNFEEIKTDEDLPF